MVSRKRGLAADPWRCRKRLLSQSTEFIHLSDQVPLGGRFGIVAARLQERISDKWQCRGTGPGAVDWVESRVKDGADQRRVDWRTQGEDQCIRVLRHRKWNCDGDLPARDYTMSRCNPAIERNRGLAGPRGKAQLLDRERALDPTKRVERV